MKRLHILGTLLALLLVPGCHREPAVKDATRPRGTARLQSVSMQLQTSEDATKSVISVEAEDFRVAYLFAFDAATQTVFLDAEGRNLALRTDSKTFNWTIPVGPDSAGNSQVMDVYAIVNPDADNAAALEEFLERDDVTEAELEELVYVCGNTLSLSGLETEGMPMSGCCKGLSLSSADEAFVLSIKRLFSRYDIRFNVLPFTGAGWSVSAAEVMASQSNTRAAYFYTGSGAGVQAAAQDLALVDLATEEDLERLNVTGADGKSTGYLTLYFLENCQGDIGPASAWDQVYAQLGNQVGRCSYVEFLVRATHPNLGERHFKYRFYPGQADDMCSNFDILRNVHRRVSLTLSPDLSSEGFRWVYDGSLQVAPGEILTLRYETSLDQAHLHFGAFQDGMVTDGISVEPSSHFDNANAAYPGHATSYPNYGVVTVKASPAAPEGSIFQMQGGDSSGQLSDKVNVTATSSVSFWKDVEVLYTPSYRGQWMVVRLPENIFGTGEVQASVRNHVLQADGSYAPINASFCSIDIAPGFESFGNGKTGIGRPHLWFDPATRLLFVYSHLSRPMDDNYSTLTLTVTEGDDGEDYETQRKEILFRQKEPELRLRTSLDGSPFAYETTYSQENHSVTLPPELYFVLVDPEMGNRIIPNEEFLWGGHGSYTMGGMSHAPYRSTTPGFWYDNFFIESYIDYSEEGDVADYFQMSHPLYPDYASLDFNLYNLSLIPVPDTHYPYDASNYFAFSHSFFSRGEVRVHPCCRLLAAPQRSLTLMKPYAGTNQYGQMQCSASPAGEDFYLMHGFCQSYFVRLENISEVPTVSASIPSSSAPYLNYSLTYVRAGLYRLDCWIDRYENPLDYDDTALPYAPGQNGPDESSGDRDVTLTVSAGTCQDQIVCHVLHKRFRLDLVSTGSRRKLQVAMWNPLGFVFKATCRFTVEFERYWYRHPIKEYFDGPCFDRQSTEFSLAASLPASPVMSGVSTLVEKASKELRGIRCHYAREVHPAYLEAGSRLEDLILYYPAAEALSFAGTLSLSSEGFSSTVPGLSLREGSFNMENYISYPATRVSFDYTLSTLSEYYLQVVLFERADITYYGYRFVTPSHWKEHNPDAPIAIDGDNPVHLDGPDRAKTLSGNFKYRNGDSFHAGNPVIGN